MHCIFLSNTVAELHFTLLLPRRLLSKSIDPLMHTADSHTCLRPARSQIKCQSKSLNKYSNSLTLTVDSYASQSSRETHSTRLRTLFSTFTSMVKLDLGTVNFQSPIFSTVPTKSIRCVHVANSGVLFIRRAQGTSNVQRQRFTYRNLNVIIRKIEQSVDHEAKIYQTER